MPATTGFYFPLNVKPVLLFSGAANAVDCDVVSMKHVEKLWFLIFHAGANDTDLTLTVTEATAVAGTSPQTVATACPIWLDADAGAASDTLVAQTAATALTIDPATQNPVLAVIEWDPAKHDHADGYDCITLADSGGHASNTIRIFALCQMKYAQATPPSVIVD